MKSVAGFHFGEPVLKRVLVIIFLVFPDGYGPLGEAVAGREATARFLVGKLAPAPA